MRSRGYAAPFLGHLCPGSRIPWSGLSTLSPLCKGFLQAVAINNNNNNPDPAPYPLHAPPLRPLRRTDGSPKRGLSPAPFRRPATPVRPVGWYFSISSTRRISSCPHDPPRLPQANERRNVKGDQTWPSVAERLTGGQRRAPAINGQPHAYKRGLSSTAPFSPGDSTNAGEDVREGARACHRARAMARAAAGDSGHAQGARPGLLPVLAPDCSHAGDNAASRAVCRPTIAHVDTHSARTVPLKPTGSGLWLTPLKPLYPRTLQAAVAAAARTCFWRQRRIRGTSVSSKACEPPPARPPIQSPTLLTRAPRPERARASSLSSLRIFEPVPTPMWHLHVPAWPRTGAREAMKPKGLTEPRWRGASVAGRRPGVAERPAHAVRESAPQGEKLCGGRGMFETEVENGLWPHPEPPFARAYGFAG